MLFTLAWRNIWRRKARSLIAIASVLFAAFIAINARSMMHGMNAKTINDITSFFTGHIQIHENGYDDKKSLNLSFDGTEELLTAIERHPEIRHIAPRLETFGLLSSGEISDGAMIIGIDPQREREFSNIAERISEGDFLHSGDAGILLTTDLADHLGLGIGDEVIIMGQGYHGISAVGKFPITGLLDFPDMGQFTGLAYLTLPAARELTGAYGKLTSIGVRIEDYQALNEVQRALSDQLGGDFEVLTWETILPEVKQMLDMGYAKTFIQASIFYLVISGGLFGTVMMMTIERLREFGMMLAIGMKRSILIAAVLIENALFMVIGALSGVLAALPMVLHFQNHPIQLSGEMATMYVKLGISPVIPFALDPMVFLNQTLIVLAISLVVSLYPVRVIARLDSVEAMRR